MNDIKRMPSAMALGNAVPAKSNDPKRTKEAAQQFEALMIQQLLKSAHGGSGEGGWLSTGEQDQTGQTAVDYAEQQFASVLSKNGGLGLTNFIVQHLQKK